MNRAARATGAAPALGTRKLPGDDKPRLHQDISLHVGIRISEVNQGQKLSKDGTEKSERAEYMTAGTALV